MFITRVSKTSQGPLKYYSDMESGTYVHRANHSCSSLAWRPMKTQTHMRNSQAALLTTSQLLVPTQTPRQLSSESRVEASTKLKVTAAQRRKCLRSNEKWLNSGQEELSLVGTVNMCVCTHTCVYARQHNDRNLVWETQEEKKRRWERSEAFFFLNKLSWWKGA